MELNKYIIKEHINTLYHEKIQVTAKVKRNIGILFLACFLIISSMPTILCGSSTTIYIAGDGSGAYNCDGKDDHIQINEALRYAANNPYTTVYLKGPFTYVINNTLLIGNYTILEGDSTAKIKLIDNAGWGVSMKPLIGPRDQAGNHDIIIQGFEIDGNSVNQKGVELGKNYYSLIEYNEGTYNITIQNMYMHNGCHDGARLKYSSSINSKNPGNIVFRNNKVYQIGHDALYCIGMNNVVAYNNDVFTRTNSAFRLHNSNHAKIYNNHVYSAYNGNSTGPGIQIQRTSSGNVMDDIEIFNNTIHTLNGAGIWMEGGDTDNIIRGSNVYIHHNIFYGVGQYWRDTGYSNSAIIIGQYNNTTIENNVIVDGGHSGIQNGPGPTHNKVLTTIVRNNIIINHNDNEAVGICNTDSTHNKFISQNNCFYNNSGGSYKGSNIIISNDIIKDPLFADITNHDYHLKSKAGRRSNSQWITDNISSPCIDAGYSLLDYSKEPEDNGDIINIGRYGNTIYASKSKSSNVAPIMESISDTTIKVGENLSFTVKASDANSDTLIYSASNLPTGSILNSESGLFSWTPTAGQEGTYKVILKVSDGTLSDSRTVNINVIKKITNVENNNLINLSGKVYDNRLREASPTSVFEENTYMDVGGVNSVGRYREIIWFNLSEYTNENEISTANLSLYWYYPNSSRPEDIIIEIYRPASAWNPSHVSWNNKNNGIPWNNPGGDWYDKNGVLQGNTPYATLTLKANSLPDNKYYQLNVTDLVKEYVSDKYANTGFLIKARTESNNYIAFYSADCGNSIKVPKLNVTKKLISNSSVNVILTGAKDNMIRESSPNTIFPKKVFIDVGGLGSSKYRDLMFFDLSGYTSEKQVNNVTLSLCWYYPNSARMNDTIIEVYRPASAWNPNYVSWNNKNNGIPWNNPGGDWYDKNGVLQGNTPYASLTLKASDLPNNKYCELNITDIVKEYTSGKYTNTGFLIKARTENNNYVAFHSADCGNRSLMPKLSMKINQ